MKRHQITQIQKDLEKKMVFLVGPRQVGKTFLAKEIASGYEKSLYLNYDHLEDRQIIEKEAWRSNTDIIILDEIHKMPQWKQYLKGVYDTKPPHLKILVTGSARLETFRKVGDSLVGRFFLHRLLPFSPSELKQVGSNLSLTILFERGGFPEPLLSDSDKEALRWRHQYTDGIIRHDILDFENINHIKTIRLLFDLLRKKVGSPISYVSLSEDLQISPNTVKKYIDILEALYIVFRVTPYSKNIARSILKEPKLYFFDSGLVDDEGPRFENFLAVCLLKHLYALEDTEGTGGNLHYLRTKDKKEVDFCVNYPNKPLQLIEAKLSDASISTSLYFFHSTYNFQAKQVVFDLSRERLHGQIEVVSARSFLGDLYL